MWNISKVHITGWATETHAGEWKHSLSLVGRTSESVEFWIKTILGPLLATFGALSITLAFKILKEVIFSLKQAVLEASDVISIRGGGWTRG